MWEYFGGLAAILAVDNLRSGVTKSDRYESLLNESYRDMDMHHGTCTIPARVRTPRDRAKVEVNVQVAGPMDFSAASKLRVYFTD